MIRHHVSVRFGPDATDADKRGLMDDLAGLRDHLDGIADFQVRPNVSPETEVVRGFRDTFWFDFRDAAARDAYLADPAHRAIGARLVAAAEGGTDGIYVCDVEL